MRTLDVALWALAVGPVLPLLVVILFVTNRFWRLRSPSANERAAIALRDWLSASVIAVLALNTLLGWKLPREITVPLLIAAVLLYSIPSAYWIWLYVRGRFA